MSDMGNPLAMFVITFAVLTLLCGGECTVTVDGTPHTYRTEGCR